MAKKRRKRPRKPPESSAVLKHLLGMPQSQIDRDIAEASRNLDRFRKHNITRRLPGNAATQARRHHERMVLARVFYDRISSREFKVCYAAMVAEQIAEDAFDVACESGRAGELSGRMTAIADREGLQGLWQLSEAPPDYLELNEEFEKLREQIMDTVMLSIFRRYRLDHVADVFETNRSLFDWLRDCGHASMITKKPTLKARKKKK
jgi:hypothetical protein